jgi:DNA polymerase V
MIGLLDANNFFVSCERVFRPDLLNRPVAVLSNNDGCFISRSNEVKALGVPMGAPYYKIKKLLEHHNVAVFSSNFALYGDLSSRMMSLIEAIVPKMEVYSIDEAFIDFYGVKYIEALCHHIREHIWRSLGIPTSIGIAQTKTLSKVANHLAKSGGDYKSVCLLSQQHEVDNALESLKVRDIWGVGYRISERLQAEGIYTGLQLKQVDARWMRRNFTVVGERLIHELNGMLCLKVEDIQDAQKSIQVSRSFAKPITDFEALRSIVATYATRLGQKLRKNGLRTSTLLVDIRTNRFQINRPQYKNNAAIALPLAVEDDLNLIKASGKALEMIFKEGFSYHKAGVMALGLVSRDQRVQFDLFAPLPTENQKEIRLYQALDSINKKFGSGMISSAACDKKLGWRDQKKNVSPAYTTCWMHLPKAFAR